MLKLKNFLYWLKICVLSPLLFGIFTSANASDASKPPVPIPFQPSKVGEVYTFQVNVVEQLTYAVLVYFYLTLPNKWSHFFDNESPEDEKRLAAMLGGTRKAESGEWVEPGVPAKFRVQIMQSRNQKIVLDELVEQPKTGSSYMGRYATLTTKNLPPDLYTIRVEYVAGAPELAPLHAKILFARAHHGK